MICAACRLARGPRATPDDAVTAPVVGVGATEPLVPDAQTERRRADLGDQFFEGVGLVAEAFAEGAIQPMSRARPVELLVRLGGQEVELAAVDREAVLHR